ncbi:ATP-binding/permease protein CydC [secondary endosymbiont of Trabutina mannipara]|uniref:ATP-binding/permease protein CydC n=1 Tax=secondary endosymbiont of Trabutina mannipara TaxID=1835721 RepID=A0A1C3L3Y2_9ENTR|nr:cysteine/glutathione ABC transporter ATP-binding protein/permease CydC [secondary endosymbiont of Trabutina mannipara]SBT81988.1 ATP-binding/permease protein CydC [secondary endosymbiont of Trabutina mannipara]
MRVLLPYLFFLHRRLKQFFLGFLLTIVTLFAHICLLTVSGWFLASAATAGIVGNFNYMLPAAGMRIAAIIRTTCRWTERVVTHDATFNVLKYLRIYTFIRILPLFPSASNHFQRTELLNRLVSDVDTLDNLYLRVISPIAVAVVVILAVTSILYLLYPKFSLTLGILTLGILVLFSLLFYRYVKSVGELITIFRDNYRQQLNTLLSSNAELTVYGAVERYRNKLDNTEKKWQIHQSCQSSIGACAQSVLQLLTGLTLTFVLWISAGSVINDSFRELIALFFFATLSVFEAIVPVAGAFQYLGQVIASAVRLNILINQLPNVVFPHRGPVPATSVTFSAHKLYFKYPQHKVPAINNLSINVAAGEHIALLGHTGSGKSTMLQLLTRAWDPQKGYITFNGIPLPQWSESALRAMTAVVPQRVYIFSATLRDNLLLAAPYVNDEKICTILNLVGLEKLLKNKGLNLWLGDGGRSLSGGEHLRIGIARILLHEAPLWLLDEPTYGLDVVTEKQILQLLIKLGKGRTLIMVTHRLQELENLDRIYIMDRGTFIEKGSHKELMEQRGRYYNYHFAGGIV